MSGSDYTLTTNYGLYKPLPSADINQWGSHLNLNADTLDGLIHGMQPATVGAPFLPLAGGTVGPTTFGGAGTGLSVTNNMAVGGLSTTKFLYANTGALNWTGKTASAGNIPIMGFAQSQGTIGAGGGITYLFQDLNSADGSAHSYYTMQVSTNLNGTKGGVGTLNVVSTTTGPTADTVQFFWNTLNVKLDLEHAAGFSSNGAIALSPQTYMGAGATNWGLVEAIEANVYRANGSTAATVQVLNVLYDNKSASHATTFETMIHLAQGVGDPTGINRLITVCSGAGQWPLDTTNGILFGNIPQFNANPGSTQRRPASCAIGFDLWAMSFNQMAWRSTGVVLDDAAISVGALQISQGTGPVIDASGSIGAIASISNPGAGYLVNDQLYDGLGGIILVTAIAGSGNVSAASYIAGKAPCFFGTGPATVTVTGGTGSGAVFNVTWTATGTLSLNPTGKQVLTNLSAAVTDAAAATAGVPIGGLYNNAGVVHVRLT